MFARIRRGGALAALLVSPLLAALPAPAHAQECSARTHVSWNTYLGGSGTDVVEDVLVNSRGEIFVTGRTDSSPFLNSESGLTPDWGASTFVAKLSADGKEVLWSRIFGTAGADSGVRMALGAFGEVYVVGQAEGPTVSTDIGGIVLPVLSYQGGVDAFLAKVDSEGNLSWFMYLGGEQSDEALGVAVDGDKVYVVGRTNSEKFVPSAKGLGARGEEHDAFIAQVQVSPKSGPEVVWTRIVGTARPLGKPLWVANDAAHSVIAREGMVYVGGVVRGNILDTDTSLKPGTVNPGFHTGAADGFLVALDPAGDVKWFVHLGGNGVTEVTDLLPQSNGDLVAVGHTEAMGFPKYWSGLNTSDVFAQVVTQDASLSPLAIRLDVPGAQSTVGRAAIDSSGQVFIGGITEAGSFNPALMGRGFDDSFSPAGWDGFVLALDPLLEQMSWGSYVGGTSSSVESVRALALDGTGTRLFIGGTSAAKDLLLRDVGYERNAPGGLNGFLFGVRQDSTPPTGGSVQASIDARGRITATWNRFADDESDIVGYEWSITDSKQYTVHDFSPVKDGSATADDLVPVPGERYVVRVRATNGVGCSVTVAASEPVGVGVQPEPPGEEPPGPEVPAPGGPLSPLGWGCGVTHPGAPPGALGLLLLALFGFRRARGGVAPRA
ncbi:hypothetical protein [Melittangium boletus]|uniref:Fibronectin type-III domain-containing protein n=1 Tax=Melittangium boletus DSM 14713 TaxID=1294270 RepID=A0A250III4_9BACT|nr:hypothetical protein [Melittangium boletus]ATB31043.1 hypothetical protein MEBOL_004505 [Melittangium boletus DSM 14713]